MSFLIEIIILDEIFMIGCENNTTIHELSLQALMEYEKSYKYNSPKTIQHVRDKQGRILSGNLQLIQLNLEKYLEIILDENCPTSIPRVVDPVYLVDLYGKWQDYIARQISTYCGQLSHGEIPTKDIMQLLDDLKNTSHETVQHSVFQSYQTLVPKIKNELIFKQIIDALTSLLMKTKSSKLVISCLTLLFQVKSSSPFSHHINNTQLMTDISTLIKQFPNNEREILNLCDQYGNTSAFFSTTTAAGGGGAAAVIGAGANGTSPKRFIGDGLKRPNSSESNSNGMSFERIIELLSSTDLRCKEFALEKLEKKDNGNKSTNEQMTTRDTSQQGNKSDFSYLSQIVLTNKVSDSYQLLRVLFDCLKSSLRPPTQQPQPSATSSSLPMTCYIVESALCSESTSLPIVTSSLRCIYQLIQFIQQRGDEWIPLSIIQPSSSSSSSSSSANTLEGILSEKWRLLLTLSHGNINKYTALVEQSSEILLFFLRACGWEKYRIKLDFDTLIFFLNSDTPLNRTYLGLEYLIYCVELHHKETSGSDPSSHLSSLQQPQSQSYSQHHHHHHQQQQQQQQSNNTLSRRRTSTNETNASYLNTLFCDDNYLIMRLLWRWIIGDYGIELTFKSLQSFAMASVLISVKSFLVKFQIYNKLLNLLIKFVDIEISSLQESLNRHSNFSSSYSHDGPSSPSLHESHPLPQDDHYHRGSIGYILKILVNINGVDESDHRNLFVQNIQLHQKLRIIASFDEFISFYCNILGII